MNLKLASGKELKVGVSHTPPDYSLVNETLAIIEELEGQLRAERDNLRFARRGNTKAFVTWEGGGIEVEGDCSDLDNFSRRVGKRLAVGRLMKELRSTYMNGQAFSKEERQQIFDALSPEYRGTKKATEQKSDAVPGQTKQS